MWFVVLNARYYMSPPIAPTLAVTQFCVCACRVYSESLLLNARKRMCSSDRIRTSFYDSTCLLYMYSRWHASAYRYSYPHTISHTLMPKQQSTCVCVYSFREQGEYTCNGVCKHVRPIGDECACKKVYWRASMFMCGCMGVSARVCA